MITVDHLTKRYGDVWERPPELPPSPEAEGLWPNLSDLLEAARALDQAGAVVVRITALGEDGGDTRKPRSGRVGLRAVRPPWLRCRRLRPAGGPTNCGYTPQEAASLAPVWAPLLNEWHLFDKPEDATAYAAVTAQRVPEHAPFFGSGIYQLR